MPNVKNLIVNGSLLDAPIDVLAGTGVGVTDIAAHGGRARRPKNAVWEAGGGSSPRR